MDYLKQPIFSVGAYAKAYYTSHKDTAEFFVTSWIKKNKTGKNYKHRQTVIDNYDFYCLFVNLLLDCVDKPYGKALETWSIT